MSLPMDKEDVDMATIKSDLYDLVQGVDCKQSAVRAVRYNVDGNYCLTCGSDKSLKLWNPVKKTLLSSYVGGHGNEVLDARGSCDNATIVSCGRDRAVLVWDVSTKAVVRSYRGCHAGPVNCVRFNEDSTVVVSGSTDTEVRCWDVRTKRQEPIQVLAECKDTVTSLDISDHEILVGCADTRLRRYDIRNGYLITDLVGLKPISSVAFTADGQGTLVAASKGDPIRLFDKSSGELLQEFSGHANPSDYRLETVLDAEDHKVLSGSEDGCVYVWDLVDASLVAKVPIEEKKDLLGGNSIVVHSVTSHPTLPQFCAAAKNFFYCWQASKL